MSERSTLDKIEKLVRSARIQEAANQRPRTFQRLRLELDAETPWSKAFPYQGAFKSIFVEDVSDPDAFVYFKPNSALKDQDYAKLSMRDSWSVDTIAANAFFSWPAQAGKWIDILFFFDSTFTSGSYTQIQAGGVKISEGTAISIGAAVTLTAGVAGIIAPASATRVVASIQNKTGADLYIGDSTVTASGATEGIKIPSDGIVKWKNAGALYGYSSAGGKVSRTEET